MSLVNLAHVCSHLQNASRARLGMTSIPYTKLHASLSNELLRAGFVSTVTVGDRQMPPASPILGHTPADPSAAEPIPVAQRRLWLGLKYWNNDPVLSKMGLVSKPTRRIWCSVEDLARLSRGQKAGYVDGLRQVGEAMFVSTDRGIMEIRECVERGVGGMLLCRAL